MARKFAELEAKMSPEARARVAARVDAIRREMPVRKLREARGLTQAQMAQLLKTGQPSVAKLEARANPHVATLQRVIRAMGGTLEVRASFPDGRDVRLADFGDGATPPKRIPSR